MENDPILASAIPLIELRDANGQVHQIYYDETIKGLKGFTVLNLASPFIRSLLYALSTNKYCQPSDDPPTTAIISDSLGLSHSSAE